jgi:uncharacterized membrane protein YphA (DoxX/SURF4 family)
METVMIIVQLVIALGIFNVWLLRFGQATGWRGGSAQNMKEEFRAYGLPDGSVYVVGFLKLLLAVLLVAGIWFPTVTRPAAIGMAVLMLGAIAMHVKVKDPLKKSLPAFTMLVLSLIVALA